MSDALASHGATDGQGHRSRIRAWLPSLATGQLQWKWWVSHEPSPTNALVMGALYFSWVTTYMKQRTPQWSPGRMSFRSFNAIATSCDRCKSASASISARILRGQFSDQGLRQVGAFDNASDDRTKSNTAGE